MVRILFNQFVSAHFCAAENESSGGVGVNKQLHSGLGHMCSAVPWEYSLTDPLDPSLSFFYLQQEKGGDPAVSLYSNLLLWGSRSVAVPFV